MIATVDPNTSVLVKIQSRFTLRRKTSRAIPVALITLLIDRESELLIHYESFPIIRLYYFVSCNSGKLFYEIGTMNVTFSLIFLNKLRYLLY